MRGFAGYSVAHFLLWVTNEAVLTSPLDNQYHYTASWCKNLLEVVVYLNLWYKYYYYK